MANEMTLLVIFVSLTLSVVSGRSHFVQQSIIKANNGQIFECVDFYKQRALENHSLNYQEVPNLAKLQQQQSTSDFGLEGRRCPLGTVPVMLRSKENVDGSVVPKPHSLPHAVENRDQHCANNGQIFECADFYKQPAFENHSLNFQANNGQIFECVDFYKQRAFENHSLNFREVPSLAKLQQQQSTSDFGLEGRRCPLGTVPIMLRSKENVDGSAVPKPHSLPHAVENRDLHCSAKIQTRANNPNKKFFGVSAQVNIFKPLVQSSQWSSARLKLINGAESIEAGWMVNPNEFKDNEAHLYASFSAGGKRCINMDCSGFVQVSTAVPLGVASPKYSEIGGRQFGWPISINKHQDDGNWWLTVGSVKVGYWPKNLFTMLRDVANQVDFGGEIDDPGMANPPPGMGNGRQAVEDTRDSSCINQVTVVDEGFNNVNPPDTERFQDCNLLYTVLDYYKSDPNLGRIIFYGGPVWAGI